MYDAVRFVMSKFELDYVSAIRKIEGDILYMQGVEEINGSKVENKFDFIPAPFLESQFYWDEYKIPIQIAAKFAFLAKSVYKNETFYARSTKANPIFIYKFTSGHIKIYRPYAEKSKK